MQSHNYVQGVSGWKMHSNGTLEVNGKIRAIMEDMVEKPDATEMPFVVEGDQFFLSQAFIGDGKLSPWTLRTTINSAGQTVLTGIGGLVGCCGESLTAKIEHEEKTRATADTQLSARIDALEARSNAAESRITQQGSAITPLK
ncbi:hypothetical protein ALQ20_00700 [Pseudomonas syringae pv. atrofaciens]|uniref:phage tail tip fiber protein n=1 Tax=Pseudomonas syringae TaxID=317 RepID=UPI000EFF1B0A|nr:hypothetical protein [Pseudomonas syringae]RMP49314.1 hypothetical protein ALQ20_00700 [Pseudomonas syringae pv. atrofaciens]